MSCHPPAQRGFTLIELLVVVAIIAVAAGMISVFPSQERRSAEVRDAANQLAATMREARNLAIRRRAIIGLAFNIANGPGTSGVVLNNWGGGHWYRLIGPNWDNFSMATNGAAAPPVAELNDGDGRRLADYLLKTQAAWFGEKRQLPARKVRFIALADQDNGGRVDWGNSNTAYLDFPPTYPRPWFGYYESATKKLHAWGGYDPAFTNPNTTGNDIANSSGFYYEGRLVSGNKTVLNSQNTVTRVASAAPAPVIFKQGEVRPVINAAFLDLGFYFFPDGTVAPFHPFKLRYQSRWKKGNAGGADATYGDIGDLYWQCDNDSIHSQLDRSFTPNAQHPLAWHEQVSGYWYVTMGPDVEQDSNQFDSARTALNSMWPMFRIGIGRFGDIVVRQVRTTPLAEDTNTNGILDLGEDTNMNGLLDINIIDSYEVDWLNGATVRDRYSKHLLRETDKITIRGRPIDDCVTTDMLANRRMWYQP